MRKPCRKSKMLTLADTNSGRRQRLIVGTELSTRKQVPALCIGEKSATVQRNGSSLLLKKSSGAGSRGLG